MRTTRSSSSTVVVVVILTMLINLNEPVEVDVECDPEVADTCFSDVHDDFRLIFDSNNSLAGALLLEDLCSAWEDSLACTVDIIDEDCANHDKLRDIFHHWISAFKSTLNYACANNASVLKDVFGHVDCFNIHDFLACTEKTANVAKVEDMLKTDFSRSECTFLEESVRKCSEYVSSCRPPLSDVLSNVTGAFFSAACCDAAAANSPASFRSHSDVIRVLPVTFLLAFFVVFVN